MIRKACEQWGNIWPKSFTERNITPKGYILSFVLPKSREELKTFYNLRGKLVERYELRNEEIAVPMRRVFRKDRLRKNKYI